jgi:hypothetical protein
VFWIKAVCLLGSGKPGIGSTLRATAGADGTCQGRSPARMKRTWAIDVPESSTIDRMRGGLRGRWRQRWREADRSILERHADGGL